MGALAAALALMVWGAAPASAGGPTSVLVVSPGSGETASLYYSDKEYAALERLLGPPDRGTRDKPPEADLASVRLINVSWMLHDVTPWRVDRVFLGSIEEDVWIHTAAKLPETPNGVWHRAEDPSDLHKLLYELGVMGHTTETGPASGIYPAPWETEASGSTAGSDASGSGAEQDAAADSGTRAASGAGDGTGWWWAIPGAVAGAVLALVLRPYVTRLPPVRRRKDDPGPRQELLDA
ncbi:hypothetical protein [Streptomyces sp. AC558_RSS880]|uniref:hypothetical protein n=1 Tax=Streptomyces sp. AC558_RSS880 TaxID=2823687 RepID=UPI0020B86DD2|nr:hypothetical protein [Streptomyces sp. AC558_RSS880]